MDRLRLKTGENKKFFIFSAVNFCLYAVWFVAYIVCVFLRAAAFNSAQSSMILSGQTNYTIEVTSPFFPVLRIFIYMLPVVMAVWTVVLLVVDRKRLELPDNKIILAVFGADTLCAITVGVDIMLQHMLF